VQVHPRWSAAAQNALPFLEFRVVVKQDQRHLHRPALAHGTPCAAACSAMPCAGAAHALQVGHQAFVGSATGNVAGAGAIARAGPE